jgi:hypothetical protein
MEGARSRVLERRVDLWYVIFEDAPFNGGERDDCQPPSTQILLEVEALISRKQNFKSVGLCCIEQFAVLEPFPTL